MRPFLAIALLALGELGDAVTTYFGKLHGLLEANPIIQHLGGSGFLLAKVLPVVAFLLLSLLLAPQHRGQKAIRSAALLCAGAYIMLTMMNAALLF